MNKLRLLLNKIKSSKFKFNLPKKKNLVIFDDTSFEDLKYIVKDQEYFLLITRFENIDTLYTSKNHLKMIKNFKGSFWSSYLISLIEIVSPKVVLTYIDNSLNFIKLQKIMEKKLNSSQFKNGARYDLNKIKYKLEKQLIDKDSTKDIFIPNFFCFGDYEKDDYIEKKLM